VSGGGSRHMPAVEVEAPTFAISNRRVHTPSADEISRNARSRSAKLRAAIRLDGAVRPLDMAAIGVAPLSQYALL